MRRWAVRDRRLRCPRDRRPRLRSARTTPDPTSPGLALAARSARPSSGPQPRPTGLPEHVPRQCPLREPISNSFSPSAAQIEVPRRKTILPPSDRCSLEPSVRFGNVTIQHRAAACGSQTRCLRIVGPQDHSSLGRNALDEDSPPGVPVVKAADSLWGRRVYRRCPCGRRHDRHAATVDRQSLLVKVGGRNFENPGLDQRIEQQLRRTRSMRTKMSGSNADRPQKFPPHRPVPRSCPNCATSGPPLGPC